MVSRSDNNQVCYCQLLRYDFCGKSLKDVMEEHGFGIEEIKIR